MSEDSVTVFAHPFLIKDSAKVAEQLVGVELDGGGHTGFRRNEWMLKARHKLDTGGEARHTLQLKLGYDCVPADRLG